MTKFRDPISALTHLIGAGLSGLGLVIMFIMTYHGSGIKIFSAVIFGLSLMLLYTTSFIYHASNQSDKVILRLKKMDHAMIFLLISGSYTPFCLLVLNGNIQIILTIAIWITAIVGILLMVFWINMPRTLNTILYIIMGWLALIALKPLYAALPAVGFWLLVAGGLFYTIGGIMYAVKKPNFTSEFGFHEVFHVFVMMGSLCHYLTVVLFVLR